MDPLRGGDLEKEGPAFSSSAMEPSRAERRIGEEGEVGRERPPWRKVAAVGREGTGRECGEGSEEEGVRAGGDKKSMTSGPLSW
jgi:hypothetical protein